MTPGEGISPGTRMKKECEARLRGLVPRGESVVALGTAEELGELRSEIGSGAGWTFIVMTEERLLFARWGSPEQPHDDLRLADVSGWASGTQYNCQAVVLNHPAATRTAESGAARTETIFRFSSPNTKLAKALHLALSARGIHHRPLHFEERSREERTRGSHVVLRWEKQNKPRLQWILQAGVGFVACVLSVIAPVFLPFVVLHPAFLALSWLVAAVILVSLRSYRAFALGIALGLCVVLMLGLWLVAQYDMQRP